MKLFDEEIHNILLKFLDKKVKKAEEEIEETGSLSDDNALPLLLKTQFNHITHLDQAVSDIREKMQDMVTKDDIKNMVVKDDIKNMATKSELQIVKDQLKEIKNDVLATKNDLMRYIDTRNHWTISMIAIMLTLLALILPIYMRYLIQV